MSARELVGEVLGGAFRVVRKLGEGGMGTVYEAVQLDLNRRVALKVIAPELAEDPRCVERLRREAEAAAALGHPSIVQVTGFHERAGEPTFLVMELLVGSPLDAMLSREGPIDPRRACTWMAQVLAALDAAHAAGIVHRDLKPGNVFIVPLGAGAELVKLLDFGVAKLHESSGYERLTATGAVVGTVRYAAPEQLDGRPVDARTDLYAAGALLYSMVAGRPPFTGESAQLALRVLTTEAPDPRTFVPALDGRLVAVIARAMRKAPAERFQSAREMAEALAAFGASIERTSADAVEPVRKAIARPEAPIAGPTAVMPRPAAPPPPERSAVLGWLLLAGGLALVPLGVCALAMVVSAVGRSTSKPDAVAPSEELPSARPIEASDALLPVECDELREVACHYPRPLTRTAECSRAALIRSRLRREIERDPSQVEAARDECRREADELRQRAAAIE